MIWALFHTPLFIVPLLAFFLGQVVKQFIFLLHGEKFTWSNLLADGGMPSSHSGVMAAFTVTLLYVEGLTALFYLSFFVTAIVAKDAYGVRRESGKHARLLQKVLKKLDLKDPEHIKLLVGHTKTQVTAGLIWGIFVAVVYHWLF